MATRSRLDEPRVRGVGGWWRRRGGRLLCCLALTGGALLPHMASAQEPGSRAGVGEIAGVVLDSAGLPLVGAVVAVVSAGLEARTGADGRFRLAGVPAARQSVVVRRLGFGPRTFDIVVTPGGRAELDARLSPLALGLDAVTVYPSREISDTRLAGFRARAESKSGGYFITRERLNRATGPSLPDLLREVPGVRIRPINGINNAVRLRGSRCAPLVFVDGFPASAGEFDLDMIDAMSLEGVEVYASLASVPAELGAARGLERCGVIALWSRPAPARQRQTRPRAERDIEALLARGEVLTASEVDQVARLEGPGTFPVEYPDSLWRAGVGGRALLEFVVDTLGRVEAGTDRVVLATHEAFGRAAREALAGLVFTSASLGGTRVRQLVQLPLVFTPTVEDPPPFR